MEVMTVRTVVLPEKEKVSPMLLWHREYPWTVRPVLLEEKESAEPMFLQFRQRSTQFPEYP